MIPVLAKTEWPSLGELVWEYLTTSEGAMFSPCLAVLAVVIACSLIQWYVLLYLTPLAPTDTAQTNIVKVNTFTKIPFLLLVYYASSAWWDIDPVILYGGLALFIITLESFIYYKLQKGDSIWDYVFFVFLSDIGCAIAITLIFLFGIFIHIFLIAGVISFVNLIKNDKDEVLECSWLFLLVFLEIMS